MHDQYGALVLSGGRGGDCGSGLHMDQDGIRRNGSAFQGDQVRQDGSSLAFNSERGSFGGYFLGVRAVVPEAKIGPKSFKFQTDPLPKCVEGCVSGDDITPTPTSARVRAATL